MQSKTLLSGIIGFLLGGLLVSVAATTFDKPVGPARDDNHMSNPAMSEMTMDEMTSSLVDKKGDDFDKAFIEAMIAHHQSAIDMARLSEARARHDEIKALSQDIMGAQQKEIEDMQSWQDDWGYEHSDAGRQDAHGM